MSVNNSNFTFLKLHAKLIRRQKEILQDLVDKFLNIFFQKYLKASTKSNASLVSYKS